VEKKRVFSYPFVMIVGIILSYPNSNTNHIQSQYNIDMKKKIGLIIFLVLLAAAIWFAVVVVNRSIQETLNPLQNVNNQLGTQVSELLHPTPTIIPDPVTIINEIRLYPAWRRSAIPLRR
jgi:hypothetical protein